MAQKKFVYSFGDGKAEGKGAMKNLLGCSLYTSDAADE